MNGSSDLIDDGVSLCAHAEWHTASGHAAIREGPASLPTGGPDSPVLPFRGTIDPAWIACRPGPSR